MSFHVGSTSSLVVKTTQLSLWLKLVWTLKRNCFLRKKNLQRISAFFSHGNPNEQSLPCIPMSSNWLKNWKKHLLVMQVMAIRGQTHHTLSQTEQKLHRRSHVLLHFCPFQGGFCSEVNHKIKVLPDFITIYIYIYSIVVRRPHMLWSNPNVLYNSLFLKNLTNNVRVCWQINLNFKRRTVFRFNLRHLWDHVSENFKVLPMKHPSWMSLLRSQHYCGLCYALMFLPHGVCRTGWKWKPCASLNSPLSLRF